jgi:hypothetical protein
MNEMETNSETYNRKQEERIASIIDKIYTKFSKRLKTLETRVLTIEETLPKK